MNFRNIVIAFDNSVAAGTFQADVNVPWPSMMTIKQIEFHDNSTQAGVFLLCVDFIPQQNAGIIAVCHDGTSLAPQSKFFIPDSISGNHTFNVRGIDKSLSNVAAEVALVLEFCKVDADENKKAY